MGEENTSNPLRASETHSTLTFSQGESFFYGNNSAQNIYKDHTFLFTFQVLLKLLYTICYR